MGVIFAFLTWVSVGGPYSPFTAGPATQILFQIISVVIIPGMFLGYLLSHNVHIVDVWLMVIGNFVVYFGLTYFVLAKREKQRAKRQMKTGNGM
jgi:hypothetical protein